MSASVEIPPGAETLDQDVELLRKLYVAHFVFAGLQIFSMIFGVTFFGIALSMIRHPDWFQGTDAPEILMDASAMTAGLVFSLLSIALAYCSYRAGRALREKRNYTFCRIVGAVNCLWMPLGPALGTATFVILARPGVRELFGVESDF